MLRVPEDFPGAGLGDGLCDLIEGTHCIPFVFVVTMVTSTTRKHFRWRTDLRLTVLGNSVDVHLSMSRVLPLLKTCWSG